MFSSNDIESDLLSTLGYVPVADIKFVTFHEVREVVSKLEVNKATGLVKLVYYKKCWRKRS